ncbi:interferon-induced protein 44-like [Gadus chalcogrammus]|uniref:interferon-induced protein 44-like n=1 Tax=Gadus chalcogrammus TaxID=1042646 RepID=UPI0024C21C04|nr:interferon-induced protein 44-like [Gadus chalcogrammus]
MSFGVPSAGTLFRPHDGKTVDNNTTTKKMEGSKEKETGSSDLQDKPDLTWLQKMKPLREVQWTNDHKRELMSKISSYKTSYEAPARVLLLGPVGSGKSSFISSVQSVFSGRVLNRAMVGSSTTGFTKKLQSFTIQGEKRGGPTALTMCDVMGLGEEQDTGISFDDIVSVLKGHAPEGHKFSPSHPLQPSTAGYLEKPRLADRVHCVVFVLDASRLSSYCTGLRETFQKLREYFSDLGVHQVTVLTHIDKACVMTNTDVKDVYKSPIIQPMMSKAGEMLGMSKSSIMPVKNYSSELDLDSNTDTLLLAAIDLILEYADLYFLDQ